MNSALFNVTAQGNGTTLFNHGDSDLVCKPGTIWTVLKFFLANYVAHCFTIRALPGESPGSYFQSALISLLYPTSDLMRAIDGIARHARFARGCKNKVQRAIRAEALLMLV
jgi:hypothetical protein